MLVWMDLEMTGLDHTADVIVEIATLVTDDELNVVAEGPDIAIHHDEDVLMRMDPLGVDIDAGGGRPAHVGVHQGARARAAHRAVVRQLDRHRSSLPRRLPARHRG